MGYITLAITEISICRAQESQGALMAETTRQMAAVRAAENTVQLAVAAMAMDLAGVGAVLAGPVATAETVELVRVVALMIRQMPEDPEAAAGETVEVGAVASEPEAAV